MATEEGLKKLFEAVETCLLTMRKDQDDIESPFEGQLIIEEEVDSFVKIVQAGDGETSQAREQLVIVMAAAIRYIEDVVDEADPTNVGIDPDLLRDQRDDDARSGQPDEDDDELEESR